MEVTWTIEALVVSPQVNGKSDVVKSAGWTCSATQDGFRALLQGVAVFPPPQGDKFTNYANLTEDIILQWVWEVCKDDDPLNKWSREIVENTARNQIAQQIAQQATEKPLPWVPPPPPVEPQPTIDERLQAAETLINLILDEEAI